MPTVKTLWVSLALLLSLAYSQFSYAQFKTEDPKGVLEDWKNWDPGSPFEQSFATCGDKVDFTANTKSCVLRCLDWGVCETKCEHPPTDYRFNLATEQCTADSVAIYGSNNFNIELTKEDYTKSADSLLVPALLQMATFLQPDVGTFKIASRLFRYVPIIQGTSKQMVRVESFFIDLEVDKKLGTYGLEVWITRDLVGIRQLLLIRAGQDIFLKQRGLILEGP